jgi:hypothetical protein
VRPATAEQVARYLADHATSLSMATLTRRLAGIRTAHVVRGFPDPTKGELIRLTFRGIKRRYGRPQRRVAALRIKHLSAIVSVLGNSDRTRVSGVPLAANVGCRCALLPQQGSDQKESCFVGGSFFHWIVILKTSR